LIKQFKLGEPILLPSKMFPEKLFIDLKSLTSNESLKLNELERKHSKEAETFTSKFINSLIQYMKNASKRKEKDEDEPTVPDLSNLSGVWKLLYAVLLVGMFGLVFFTVKSILTTKESPSEELKRKKLE